MSSQPETDARLMSSHSNSVTILLSSHTSARSWTASWLPIPLWPHWQNSQHHQAPVQPVALPLWGRHHLSHSKALPQGRPILLPPVSTSTGRWLHTAMQESHNPVGVYRIKHFPSRARPKTTPGTTLPGPFSFRTLTAVST